MTLLSRPFLRPDLRWGRWLRAGAVKAGYGARACRWLGI